MTETNDLENAQQLLNAANAECSENSSSESEENVMFYEKLRELTSEASLENEEKFITDLTPYRQKIEEFRREYSNGKTSKEFSRIFYAALKIASLKGRIQIVKFILDEVPSVVDEMRLPPEDKTEESLWMAPGVIEKVLESRVAFSKTDLIELNCKFLHKENENDENLIFHEDVSGLNFFIKNFANHLHHPVLSTYVQIKSLKFRNFRKWDHMSFSTFVAVFVLLYVLVTLLTNISAQYEKRAVCTMIFALAAFFIFFLLRTFIDLYYIGVKSRGNFLQSILYVLMTLVTVGSLFMIIALQEEANIATKGILVSLGIPTTLIVYQKLTNSGGEPILRTSLRKMKVEFFVAIILLTLIVIANDSWSQFLSPDSSDYTLDYVTVPPGDELDDFEEDKTFNTKNMLGLFLEAFLWLISDMIIYMYWWHQSSKKMTKVVPDNQYSQEVRKDAEEFIRNNEACGNLRHKLWYSFTRKIVKSQLKNYRNSRHGRIQIHLKTGEMFNEHGENILGLSKHVFVERQALDELKNIILQRYQSCSGVAG